MSKRLTGLNPLAYMGVEPGMPSNTYTATTSPTPNDVQNFNIGDFWVNTTTKTLYVLVNQGRGVATWVTTFGGAASSFVTDSGTANDIAGVINILGDGTHIDTSASGNTITISLDSNPLEIQNLKLDGQIDGVLQADASGNITATNGSNGQILIGGGTAPIWANITAGSNINITNGANSIVIAASGAGGGGATTFITDDAGPVSELAGDIIMKGGNNITTDGSVPTTVTFNLTGTNNHAVQVGNSSGSLDSLSVGTDGEVLIGVSGGDPVFNSITSSDSSITITPGPGTLDLVAAGGGGSGLTIITIFDTPGPHTWTKNVSTKYVEVYGWGGGGGGGSGACGSTVGSGGSGGSPTSMFHIFGPASESGPIFSVFGTTEDVVVGAGGLGGASVMGANLAGNPGMDGTPSSFGNCFVPATISMGSDSGNGRSGGNAGFVNINAVTKGGSNAGIFEMGFGNIYDYYTGGSAASAANKVSYGGAAGGATFSDGAPAIASGGFFDGANYTYSFLLPTGGGGGSPWNNNGAFNNPGGNGGDYLSFDGVTVIDAGGLGGQTAISPDGSNGSDKPVMGGMLYGGLGGGGGKGTFGGSTAGHGGDGGFPGGGGGGGGGTVNGMTSGYGGNGGNGLVVVIEWT